MNNNAIDITFDFRTDSNGKDPDSHSPTLLKYHRLLWSKPLPIGGQLVLDRKLKYNTSAGNLKFTSDSVIHTFARWTRYQHIISQIPRQKIEYFNYIGYTIGAMLIFPGNRVGYHPTINGMRGFSKVINDRLDLTLECIRLHYAKSDNPLSETLQRYNWFFEWFIDFEQYINFFLLQDIVDDNYNIKFFTAFDSFKSPSLPQTVDEYNLYMENSLGFVNNRNLRIQNWGKQNLKDTLL